MNGTLIMDVEFEMGGEGDMNEGGHPMLTENQSTGDSKCTRPVRQESELEVGEQDHSDIVAVSIILAGLVLYCLKRYIEITG